MGRPHRHRRLFTYRRGGTQPSGFGKVCPPAPRHHRALQIQCDSGRGTGPCTTFSLDPCTTHHQKAMHHCIKSLHSPICAQSTRTCGCFFLGGGDSRPEIPATSNELVDPAQTFLTGLSWVTEYGASAGPAHGRRRLWEFPVPCPSGRGPYGLIGPRGRVSLSLPLSKSKMSCDGNSCAAGNLKSTSQYGAF